MKNITIENYATAKTHIESMVAKEKAKLAEIEKPTAKEIEAARNFNGEFTPDVLAGMPWVNVHRTIARLDETLAKIEMGDLIFAKGKFVLVPIGERLLSPAGFHPDTAVFIKPSKGAVVNKLPKSSNMSYYDFTN